MAKSDLPFGAQFTPNQIQLSRVLQIIHNHAGNRTEIERVIANEFFGGKTELSENTFLALRAYRLLTENENDPRPTSLASELLATAKSEDDLYWQFGRHILLNLHGYDLVQTILDMERAHEEVRLLTIHARLADRGIRFSASGTYISGMRLWLEKAGIFSEGYNVDIERLEHLMGATTAQVDILANLETEQRDFLKALASLGDTSANPSNEVAKLANRLYGTVFDPKALPGKVLSPLEDAGFIAVERSTEGRGAKPHLVKPTAGFTREVILPLLEAASIGLDSRLREMLYRPLAEIIDELDSEDKNIKGKALEALVLRLTRLLDLQFVGWRLRQKRTGGAEVDVLVESDRLIFSRWQIQCKNTARVELGDIAKEVGLTFYLKSNVIMIVTTGRIGRPARDYATGIMQTTNLHIILIEKRDLAQLRLQPTAIVGILDREAKNAMQLKELKIKLEEI